MNKKQRVLNWASSPQRKRHVQCMAGMCSELGYPEQKVKNLLNDLRRKGLVTYKCTGRTYELHLTREAYYARKELGLVA